MERQAFDKAIVDEAIGALCEMMDDMELTLFERWWVTAHIAVTAKALMNARCRELADKFGLDPLGAPDEELYERFDAVMEKLKAGLAAKGGAEGPA